MNSIKLTTIGLAEVALPTVRMDVVGVMPDGVKESTTVLADTSDYITFDDVTLIGM